MSRYEYVAPSTIDEAKDVVAEYGGDVTPLAGGTDLIVQTRERSRPVRVLMALRRLQALGGHELQDGILRVGAMASAYEVARSPTVQQVAAALADSAELIGSIQIMHRATVAGNVCNAAPSADTGAALVVLDAEAVVVGPEGTRPIPIHDLIQGPGQTALAPGEFVQDIVVPVAPPNSGSAYERHTPRKEMDIAVVGVGAFVRLDEAAEKIEEARVALCAVAPIWPRSLKAEGAIVDVRITSIDWHDVGQGAAADASPISDLRGSASMRTELLKVYAPRVIKLAIARAQQNSRNGA